MVQYCRPVTVDDAIQRLVEAEGDGRVLIGGTDLLIGVRRHPLEPLVLIDLKTAVDLPPAIEESGDAIRLGPTATMSDLSTNADVGRFFPALVAASRVVGSIAIRNRASLIGNLCNASPAADTAPALLVHEATVTIVGRDGERTIPLTDFFIGPGRTACQPDELVIRVELPIPDAGDRSAFERLTRRRGVDLATVSAAARIRSDGAVSIGLGAVGPTPLLARTSEPLDVTDSDALDRAVAELTAIATPISDVRAGAEYRRAMTSVLTRRAIDAALAGGPIR